MAETKAQNSALSDRRVVLEFPRGRFQENSAPTYFRWTNLQPVDSVTLTVFRTDNDGQLNATSDLLARYDYTGSVQSMNWTQETFSAGHYLWRIEGFDKKSPQPLFTKFAQFSVESIKHYDLQATRMGLLVGFSRGKFISKDPAFEVEFDTTPTRYGLSLRGGNTTSGWDVTAFASDFILRGGVRRTFSLVGAYYWRIHGASPYGFQIFAGPSLRAILFPLVRAIDTTNIEDEQVTSYNPGGTLYMRQQFSPHLALFSQIHMDLSVAGSKDVPEMDQYSTHISVGSIFSLFWPFGLSGELRHSSENYKMRDRGDLVESKTSEWAIIGNLVYSF